VGYDNQLVAIERSLKGKEHDFEELLLLAHDATHAKELSQAELKKYEHKKEAVKELRKAYLDDKRRAIESREDILMKIQKREKEPVDQEFSDKIESKKINQNNFEQKINIDQNINM
jgi:coiled-coil domain-containing protein 151